MPSDIEIAQASKMVRIAKLAQDKLGIAEEHLEPYGHYKAKVSLPFLDTLKDKKNGKDNLIGVNKANCSNLMIYIKDNGVEKITFLKKPDATLFPMSDFTPKEFLLKDFLWREKERPNSVTDIFFK